MPENLMSTGVKMAFPPAPQIVQVSAWADTVSDIAKVVDDVANKNDATLIRTHPLTWWVVDDGHRISLPAIDAQSGTVLDLTQSRMVMEISGPDAEPFLRHCVSIDLSAESFKPGDVAQCPLHSVPVLLHRLTSMVRIYVPASYAESLIDLMKDIGNQFGLSVEDSTSSAKTSM